MEVGEILWLGAPEQPARHEGERTGLAARDVRFGQAHRGPDAGVNHDAIGGFKRDDAGVGFSIVQIECGHAIRRCDIATREDDGVEQIGGREALCGTGEIGAHHFGAGVAGGAGALGEERRAARRIAAIPQRGLVELFPLGRIVLAIEFELLEEARIFHVEPIEDGLIRLREISGRFEHSELLAGQAREKCEGLDARGLLFRLL